MNGTPDTSLRLLVVGANHRSSTLALRDRLFVEERDAPAFLAGLKAVGIDDALVLATCDRVEVQTVLPDGMAAGTAADAILAALAAHGQAALGDLDGQTYTLEGEEGLRHIFAVAASLDSMMVGEPQVLGQVKDGHRIAREGGFVKGGLEAVMQAAYGAAKRVRHETTIGARPVSIASAAVQVARDLFGDLSRASGLLVGVGDMGELIAHDLKGAGLGRLVVTHRVARRADSMAKDLACQAAPFEDLDALLVQADIVLVAMGARGHVLDAPRVGRALSQRRHKPQFLIDAGVPGDIAPDVAVVEDAFLYELGDLERVAMQGRALRKGEASKAWSILDEEVDAFLHHHAERAAVPVLSDLHARFRDARDSALRDADGDAEKAVRLFMGRVLHNPSETLRGLASDDADFAEKERLIRTLFALDDGAGNKKEKE